MSTEVVKMSPGLDPGHTIEALSLLSPVAAEASLPKDNFFFFFFLREEVGWGFAGKESIFSSMVGLS